MPATLRRLIAAADQNDRVDVQETEFSIDVLGRYICSTWEEATQNGGPEFDAVVIGAGMFGAYCAEKIYRNSGMRVLVLDAGALLVTEHVQNLSRIGLGVAGAAKVETNAADPGTRERVWGIPWRSRTAFPGLAYCLGGRSLFWGGWAPRLTDDDLEQWPSEVAHAVRNGYVAVERETGVARTTDYISGPLYDALRTKFDAVKNSVPTVVAIEEAPLAVQADAPAAGLFSFDKWSSAPILTDAIREATANPDWQRRLFYVPRTHVTRLQTTGGFVSGIELQVKGVPRFLPVSTRCAIVLANGAIESTRLAMESFSTPLMGRNLMAHLRSNTVLRIKRSALGAPAASVLEAAALLVRGAIPTGRYHIQVTAAAVAGASSEATMWRMIPDIDVLDHVLANQNADWIVITLRGIGEMLGARDDTAPKVTGAVPSFMDLSDQTDQFGLRRAWVNLEATPADIALWNTMDTAAIALGRKLANDDPALIQYFHGGAWQSTPPAIGAGRDGLGTTHHEAGTLWIGDDLATSVTNLHGRFHHIANAWVAGPALFPTLGSANPALTALALARRTALKIAADALDTDPGFTALGNGSLADWRMAGSGRFIELGANIIESTGGTGLLWYSKEQHDDFVLRGEFRLSSGTDNSGIFFRFPEPGHSDPANDWKPAATLGYEVQIDNTGFNPVTNAFDDPLHRTGAIYTLAPSSGPMPAVGLWHDIEIEALGALITVRIDGVLTSQLAGASRSPKGYIGLQNHHAGSKVQFRRLRVKKLVAAGAPVAVMAATRQLAAARRR